MAMIKCPECGRDISSWVPACPGCGLSQKNIKKRLADQREATQNKPASRTVSSQTVPSHTVSSASGPEQQTPVVILEKMLDKVQVTENREIKCIICKYTYKTNEFPSCPKCKYPVLSLCQDKQTEKREVRAYRKETGFDHLDLEVGQYHTMGHYGGEEINWLVLAVENGKALLISEKGLDAKAYNDERKDVTWETCSLRKWLNNDLISEAFDSDEIEKITTTKLVAEQNPEYRSNFGKDTEDKVFLLSIQEVEMYFMGNNDRKAEPSDIAKKNGSYVDDSTKCCWWWLRTSGRDSNYAAFIFDDGWIGSEGLEVDCDDGCVRPALWVELGTVPGRLRNDVHTPSFGDGARNGRGEE